MKRITLAIMLTAWGCALAACGSSSTSSSSASSGGGAATGGTANCPAPNGASTNGSGTSLKIGSKGFAEEQILAELAKQALTKAGFSVDYSTQEADPQLGQDLSA